MGSPPSVRGNAVLLDDDWWQACKDAVATMPRDRRGLIALGKALAKAIKRPRAWNKNAVAAFLAAEPSERVTTIEMAEAFSALLDLPGPVPASLSEDERRWLDVGRGLLEFDRDRFDHIVDTDGAFISAARLQAEMKGRRN